MYPSCIVTFRMGTMEASRPPAPRVVVVDPDPVSLGRLRETLEPEGLELQCVLSGAAAREAFRTAPPTACVLELSLPDTPGLDLLRELRREYPNTAFLALSAQVAPHEIVAALKLGAVDFVAKPVDPSRFRIQVRNALQEVFHAQELDRARAEVGDGLTSIQLDQILQELIVRGGSDLHLKVGRPPLMRISGDLVPTELPEIAENDMKGLLLQMLGREGLAALEANFECDTSYLLPGVARFRVNAFRRMGQFGAALRMIPLAAPTIEAMGLPDVLKEICKAPHGLVLITGPTGSGKSTTLAAMIEHLNQTQSLHVVTIEDPVEFVYTDRKCTINQRQLGTDVKSLHEALRRALRQDPDVILIGEMRDMETIELAMHAAETGHLVFSTLHTNDAKQTLDRIVDTFPSAAAPQVRAMLALTLQAVISQRLVRRADGKGRVAAVEVMINSPNIRELIAEGKTSQIEKAIAASGDFYRMQTFNQALARLVLDGVVAEEEALASTQNPGDLRLLLKGVTSGSTSALRGADAGRSAADSGKIKINRGF
jgi:twitching motility protein PilT